MPGSELEKAWIAGRAALERRAGGVTRVTPAVTSTPRSFARGFPSGEQSQLEKNTGNKDLGMD